MYSAALSGMQTGHGALLRTAWDLLAHTLPGDPYSKHKQTSKEHTLPSDQHYKHKQTHKGFVPLSQPFPKSSPSRCGRPGRAPSPGSPSTTAGWRAPAASSGTENGTGGTWCPSQGRPRACTSRGRRTTQGSWSSRTPPCGATGGKGRRCFQSRGGRFTQVKSPLEILETFAYGSCGFESKGSERALLNGRQSLYS